MPTWKTTTMRLIKEIEIAFDVGDINVEDLHEEIALREDLLKMMVGSLYPSIVWDEIEKIEGLLNEADTGNP